MSIQLLTLSPQSHRFQGSATTLSTFSNPRPFDDYTWNVVDLNSPYIWRSKQSTYHRIALEDELKIIGKMTKQAEKAKVLVLLPQNLTFDYHYLPFTAYKYQKRIPLKEILPVVDAVLSPLFPVDLDLYPLKTGLDLMDKPFMADFALRAGKPLITSSDQGKRLVYFNNRLFASTLAVANYDDLLTLIDVLEAAYEAEEKTIEPPAPSAEETLPDDLPAWLDDFSFGEDRTIEEKIRQHEKAILQLKADLVANRATKKLLVAADAELAQLAVDALQEATNTSLGDILYLDLEKGAFIFNWSAKPVIGFVTSPDDAISEAEFERLLRLRQVYSQKKQLPAKTIPAFLIANPQRHLPPTDRKPFTVNQVEKAATEHILIIPTTSLLHLLNDVRHGQKSAAAIRELLLEETGLLRI